MPISIGSIRDYLGLDPAPDWLDMTDVIDLLQRLDRVYLAHHAEQKDRSEQPKTRQGA